MKIKKLHIAAFGFVSAILALVVVPQPSYAAETCAAACDVDCETCCKSWSLRATCSDGTIARGDATFPSAAEAQKAAASSTTAPICPGIAASPAPGAPSPKWAAYCAPELAVASPFDSAPSATALTVVISIEARLRAIEETQSALARFAKERIVNAKGQKAIPLVADALRSSRTELREAGYDARRTRAKSGLTDADAKALEGSMATPLQRAADADARGRELMGDISLIDAAAEERVRAAAARVAAETLRKEEAERRRVEAADKQRADAEDQARKRRESADRSRAETEELTRAKQEAAVRAKADAEAKRAEAARLASDAAARQKAQADADALARAEVVRLAALAAQRKQEEADRAKQEAEARSDAQVEGKLKTESDETTAGIDADLQATSSAIAGLTMVQMQPSSSPAAKTKATDVKAALQHHKEKLRTIYGKVLEAKDKRPMKAGLAAMQQLHREAQGLHHETDALVASAKAIK